MITTFKIEGFIDTHTHQDFIKRLGRVREYELQINVKGDMTSLQKILLNVFRITK